LTFRCLPQSSFGRPLGSIGRLRCRLVQRRPHIPSQSQVDLVSAIPKLLPILRPVNIIAVWLCSVNLATPAQSSVSCAIWSSPASGSGLWELVSLPEGARQLSRSVGVTGLGQYPPEDMGSSLGDCRDLTVPTKSAFHRPIAAIPCVWPQPRTRDN
jgi:hypothetical protein